MCSYIMRRREFDPTFLNLDGDNQLNCSLEDRHVAYRYRLLLFKTQAYVQRAIQWQVRGRPWRISLASSTALLTHWFRCADALQQGAEQRHLLVLCTCVGDQLLPRAQGRTPYLERRRTHRVAALDAATALDTPRGA